MKKYLTIIVLLASANADYSAGTDVGLVATGTVGAGAVGGLGVMTYNAIVADTGEMAADMLE
ncbi:MAG: hypothetical protein P8L77_04780 [Gammaproteobacteria bacterium]|nr:hypothetical protein [Gammaproteobacteria bacterium]